MLLVSAIAIVFGFFCGAGLGFLWIFNQRLDISNDIEAAEKLIESNIEGNPAYASGAKAVLNIFKKKYD